MITSNNAIEHSETPLSFCKKLIMLALQNTDLTSGIKIQDLLIKIKNLNIIHDPSIKLPKKLIEQGLDELEKQFIIIYWPIGEKRTKKYCFNPLTLDIIHNIYRNTEEMGVAGWKKFWRALKFKSRYMDRLKEYLIESGEFDVLSISRESGAQAVYVIATNHLNYTVYKELHYHTHIINIKRFVNLVHAGGFIGTVTDFSQQILGRKSKALKSVHRLADELKELKLKSHIYQNLSLDIVSKGDSYINRLERGIESNIKSLIKDKRFFILKDLIEITEFASSTVNTKFNEMRDRGSFNYLNSINITAQSPLYFKGTLFHLIQDLAQSNQLLLKKLDFSVILKRLALEGTLGDYMATIPLGRAQFSLLAAPILKALYHAFQPQLEHDQPNLKPSFDTVIATLQSQPLFKAYRSILQDTTQISTTSLSFHGFKAYLQELGILNPSGHLHPRVIQDYQATKTGIKLDTAFHQAYLELKQTDPEFKDAYYRSRYDIKVEELPLMLYAILSRSWHQFVSKTLATKTNNECFLLEHGIVVSYGTSINILRQQNIPIPTKITNFLQALKELQPHISTYFTEHTDSTMSLAFWLASKPETKSLYTTYMTDKTKQLNLFLLAINAVIENWLSIDFKEPSLSFLRAIAGELLGTILKDQPKAILFDSHTKQLYQHLQSSDLFQPLLTHYESVLLPTFETRLRNHYTSAWHIKPNYRVFKMQHDTPKDYAYNWGGMARHFNVPADLVHQLAINAGFNDGLRSLRGVSDILLESEVVEEKELIWYQVFNWWQFDSSNGEDRIHYSLDNHAFFNYMVEGGTEAMIQPGGRMTVQTHTMVQGAGYFGITMESAWQTLHNLTPAQIARQLGIIDFNFLGGFNPSHRNVTQFFEHVLADFAISCNIKFSLLKKLQHNLQVYQQQEALVAIQFLKYLTQVFELYFKVATENYLARGRSSQIFDVGSSMLVYPVSIDLPAVNNYLSELQEELVQKTDVAKQKLFKILNQSGWTSKTVSLEQLTINKNRDKQLTTLHMQEPYEFLISYLAWLRSL